MSERLRALGGRGGPAADFLSGMRLVGRGLILYGRNPSLVLLGIIPALITAIIFVGLLVVLLLFVDDLARLVTWFADGWSPDLRGAVRVLAGIGIIGVAGLLGIVSFTAVTLLIGDPFYERISERIEYRFGGVPDEVTVPWYRSWRRSLRDSIRLLLVSASIGVPLFIAGFIPLIGQTVIPAIGACVAGWFLALELTGVPFSRRGITLQRRRALLRANRPMVLGFGVTVFLCFLIPLGAVLVMPAAVAGGTLLARRALGLSTEDD